MEFEDCKCFTTPWGDSSIVYINGIIVFSSGEKDRYNQFRLHIDEISSIEVEISTIIIPGYQNTHKQFLSVITIIEKNNSQEYKVTGNWGVGKDLTELFEFLHNVLPKSIHLTRLEYIERYCTERRNYYRRAASTTLLLLLIIFLVFYSELRIKHIYNFVDFEQTNKEVTKQLLRRSPKINHALCVKNVEVLYRTLNQNQFVVVNKCDWLIFKYYFGKQKLTQEQAEKTYNIEIDDD